MKNILSALVAIVSSYAIAPAQDFSLTSSSFIGDVTEKDEVRGARVQSDGTMVIGAITTTHPSEGEVALLNGATDNAAGTIIRLSKTGSIISVTKVGNRVLDIDLDADDNIYAALGNGGFVKLDPTASSLIYQRDNGGSARRIDAADDGTVVALSEGIIYVYNALGEQIASFSGKNFTEDVAVSAGLQRVFSVGFRNANSGCNPVQVAYLRAHDFSGAEVWRDYDHPATLLDNCDKDGLENNMADTRGYRVSLGEDGYLYAAFEVAGGNHIFRKSPHDLKTSVQIVGGDKHHEFYNTKSEHKTFFARYDPATGEYLKGQQFVGRLSDGGGNAVRIKEGDIQADAKGRVYLGGAAASGLPLTFAPSEAGSYTGGAWVLVMSSDFKKRLLVSRIGQGKTKAVGVRTVGEVPVLVWGGQASEEFHPMNAFQSALAGGAQDGFYGSSNLATDPVDYVLSTQDSAPQQKDDAAPIVYPNPASGNVVFNFDKKINGRLFLLNLNGMSVYEADIFDDTSVDIDLSGFAPGMYLGKIVQEDQISVVKIVVE